MGKTIISDCGQFEWDEDKNKLNIEKHGLSFEKILSLFDDPYSLDFFDNTHSDDEDRFFTTGNVLGTSVLLVTAWSVTRGKRIRLISARIASKNEEQIYYENQKNIHS